MQPGYGPQIVKGPNGNPMVVQAPMAQPGKPVMPRHPHEMPQPVPVHVKGRRRGDHVAIGGRDERGHKEVELCSYRCCPNLDTRIIGGFFGFFFNIKGSCLGGFKI